MSRIIFLSKGDAFSAQARQIAKILWGADLECFEGRFGDGLPSRLDHATPDLLLSFLSPWIVPATLLERAGQSINFHPATHEYPGYAPYNFALYDEAPEYGAICHHMAARVDTGAIIEERRFPILPTDTVETLKYRTLVTLLGLFHDIASRLRAGTPLPKANLKWTRAPYTRKDLLALMELTPGMAEAEIQRRVRACTYPGYPGLKRIVNGEITITQVPDRKPLA